MSNNSGGPWGGGGNWGGGGRGDDERGDDRRPADRRPGDPQIPEIDEIVRKGQEQLRVLMGGRGGGGDGEGGGPRIGKGGWVLVGLAALAGWLWMSVYTVRPEQQSVELFLGEFYKVGEPGLNIAPWPLVTYQIVETRRERVQQIGGGTGRGAEDEGLMLTGDENIVDIDFQVVWNVNNPERFLFTLRDPAETIEAVSESAMREIIAQSRLAPVLNRDRGIIASQLQEVVQATLDGYGAGINVVRVNFDKADPPREVIDAFRDVQAAEQERDELEKRADRDANRLLADARGESAQLLEDAEGYRARVVNEATGEASRFEAVLDEYERAPEVTRRRLYIETMENVMGATNKLLLDESIIGSEGGSGVVPYLPLNELRGPATLSREAN
ncbi:MAG TPA: FtsH protease activity modulator HflK [Rhodobacteraceae bacterium]|jgi:membrane protease subunit HflK|nr:FtsH protease activity modulator HflK [Paracoccaceae bacterium]HBH00056.1 FtsH protease activity modulator HflK [Paracoccaceae bacterium]